MEVIIWYNTGPYSTFAGTDCVACPKWRQSQQIVLFRPVPELWAAQSHEVGGPGQVSRRPVERLLEQALLHGFPIETLLGERDGRRAVSFLAAGVWPLGEQIRAAHDLALAKDAGHLHLVPELSHIAAPTVLRKSPLCLWSKPP